MRPFYNNLVREDRVFDTATNRHGKVCRTPQSSSQRMTPVILDGTNSVRYIDVMQLRLVADGRTPEDDPPVDGEPDKAGIRTEAAAPVVTPASRPLNEPTTLDLLRTRRATIQQEIAAIETRFKALKAEDTKLEQAINILSA